MILPRHCTENTVMQAKKKQTHIAYGLCWSGELRYYSRSKTHFDIAIVSFGKFCDVGVCSTAVDRRTVDPAAGDRLPICAPLA